MWYVAIFDFARTQVIYVLLYSLGVKINIKSYLRKVATPQEFPGKIEQKNQGFLFICAYIDDLLILIK